MMSEYRELNDPDIIKEGLQMNLDQVLDEILSISEDWARVDEGMAKDMLADTPKDINEHDLRVREKRVVAAIEATKVPEDRKDEVITALRKFIAVMDTEKLAERLKEIVSKIEKGTDYVM